MDPFDYYPSLSFVRRYVRSNIESPIKLRDVASKVQLSETHFSRTFHRSAGIRFQDWLRMERVLHAKFLIGNSNISITHAAFSSGFGSISAFERAFKKFEGMPPSEFRKQQRRRLNKNVC